MTQFEYLEEMERRSWQTAAKLTDPTVRRIHEDAARAFRERRLNLSLSEARKSAPNTNSIGAGFPAFKPVKEKFFLRVVNRFHSLFGRKNVTA